jgi:hypothetical protein
MLNTKRFANRLSSSIAGAALALIAQAPVAAPLINGGFETGDLSGWTLSVFGDGSAAALTNLETPSVTPAHGNYMALLSNGGIGQTLIPDIGSHVPAVNHGLPVGVTAGAGAILDFSGYANYFCTAVQCEFASDFAQLWQTFTTTGAASLSFDWTFLTNEVTLFDYAYVSIMGPSLTHIEVLAYGGSLSATLDGVTQSEGRYGGFTGGGHFAISLSDPGAYIFALGVTNTLDPAIASALIIDNVQVMPEPTVLLLLVVGLAGLIYARQSRRQ